MSLLTSLERIRSHALSPDGQRIACIKDGESFSDVHLIPSSGGWLTRLTTDRPRVPYWDDEIPAWSPDGKWIAFGIHGHVHLISCEGGWPRKITDFAISASSPCFMPDSHGLIVTIERNETDQLLLTDIEGCWPRALTTDTTGDHWDARPSPDGKSVLYVLRRFDDLNRLDIVLLEIGSGKSVTLYGKPSTRALSPKWSPDGQWIAFIAQETERDEIYLIRPDGEGLHQLTNAGSDVAQFEWSPNSKQLAVVFNRSGAFDLSLVEMETGSVADLRSGKGRHSNPNWSRDGSFITFEHESPLLPPDLYRIDLSIRQVTQLTFSNPPALERNRKVMPEVVSYKSYDDLKIPAFLYRPEKPNGAAIRMINMHLFGTSLLNTLLQRDILTCLLITADPLATAKSTSAPITKTGASAIHRTVCMARNSCMNSSKVSKRSVQKALALSAAAMAVTWRSAPFPAIRNICLPAVSRNTAIRI